MKPVTKLVLAFITVILVISFVVVWDLYIKESIESEEVVVLKPNVVLHEYDKLTQSDVLFEQRNRATLIEGYITPTEFSSIEGSQVNQTVVGNQILSKRYIELESFEPNAKEGESIRPIPNQWIYAMPATLRRQDKIDIYLALEAGKEPSKTVTESSEAIDYVGLSPEQELVNEMNENSNYSEDQAYAENRESIITEKELDLDVNVLPPNDSAPLLGDSQEVLDFESERKRWLEKKGLTEIQWNTLALNGDIPVLVDVPVAYAKDGSGNEIRSSQDAPVTEEETARLTSTGAITNLELILSENNHRLLMNYINQGYQLYITYN